MHLDDYLDIFVCPGCGADLKVAGDEILCTHGRHRYRIEDGIPLLFLPNEWNHAKKDVTDAVQSFYEKTPFPNYDGIESVGDLIEVTRRGIFAHWLNEQIPFNVRILEVGCGTGQLSNFLSVAHRVVFGTDLCLHSLKLAQGFKKRNHLERVGFYQMNLFRPAFREESFHFLICNGVLHHTSDPFLGFRSISKLVKKGGYLLIGLYNRYGRMTTDIRRVIFKMFNNRFKVLDPRLRREDMSDLKKLAWFLDQYKHPHESKHTVGEVLRWFDQTGFEFVNSVPKLNVFEGVRENEGLFKPTSRGNGMDHLIAQIFLALRGSVSGGFFITIGKRVL